MSSAVASLPERTRGSQRSWFCLLRPSNWLLVRALGGASAEGVSAGLPKIGISPLPGFLALLCIQVCFAETPALARTGIDRTGQHVPYVCRGYSQSAVCPLAGDRPRSRTAQPDFRPPPTNRRRPTTPSDRFPTVQPQIYATHQISGSCLLTLDGYGCSYLSIG